MLCQRHPQRMFQRMGWIFFAAHPPFLGGSSFSCHSGFADVTVALLVNSNRVMHTVCDWTLLVHMFRLHVVFQCRELAPARGGSDINKESERSNARKENRSKEWYGTRACPWGEPSYTTRTNQNWCHQCRKNQCCKTGTVSVLGGQQGRKIASECSPTSGRNQQPTQQCRHWKWEGWEPVHTNMVGFFWTRGGQPFGMHLGLQSIGPELRGFYLLFCHEVPVLYQTANHHPG